MRRFVSSKVLLLAREISHDNAAYNGGADDGIIWSTSIPLVLGMFVAMKNDVIVR